MLNSEPKSNKPIEISITDYEKINGSQTILKISSKKNEGNIKSFCRIRPNQTFYNAINKFEIQNNSKTLVVDFTSETEKNTLKKLKYKYNFAKVFSPNTTNQQIFETICKPIIYDLFFNQKNGLIFVYGITNSGKTYTINGKNETPGILFLSLQEIFIKFSYIKPKKKFLELSCTYIEIYNEEIFDLLSNIRQKIKLTGTRNKFIPSGCIIKKIENFSDFTNALNFGLKNRKETATNSNTNSSRSHTIFRIEISNKNFDEENENFSLSIVDLAGAERVNKTGMIGNGVKEAGNINKSLLTLKNCIDAMEFNSRINLIEQKKIVPVRESKLTMLFSEYFGNNNNISIICTINPDKNEFLDLRNVLNFGVKALKVKPMKSFVYQSENSSKEKSVKKGGSKNNSHKKEYKLFTSKKSKNIKIENQENEKNEKKEKKIVEDNSKNNNSNNDNSVNNVSNKEKLLLELKKYNSQKTKLEILNMIKTNEYVSNLKYCINFYKTQCNFIDVEGAASLINEINKNKKYEFKNPFYKEEKKENHIDNKIIISYIKTPKEKFDFKIVDNGKLEFKAITSNINKINVYNNQISINNSNKNIHINNSFNYPNIINNESNVQNKNSQNNNKLGYNKESENGILENTLDYLEMLNNMSFDEKKILMIVQSTENFTIKNKTKNIKSKKLKNKNKKIAQIEKEKKEKIKEEQWLKKETFKEEETENNEEEIAIKIKSNKKINKNKSKNKNKKQKKNESEFFEENSFESKMNNNKNNSENEEKIEKKMKTNKKNNKSRSKKRNKKKDLELEYFKESSIESNFINNKNNSEKEEETEKIDNEKNENSSEEEKEKTPTKKKTKEKLKTKNKKKKNKKIKQEEIEEEKSNSNESDINDDDIKEEEEIKINKKNKSKKKNKTKSKKKKKNKKEIKEESMEDTEKDDEEEIEISEEEKIYNNKKNKLQKSKTKKKSNKKINKKKIPEEIEQEEESFNIHVIKDEEEVPKNKTNKKNKKIRKEYNEDDTDEINITSNLRNKKEISLKKKKSKNNDEIDIDDIIFDMDEAMNNFRGEEQAKSKKNKSKNKRKKKLKEESEESYDEESEEYKKKKKKKKRKI